MRCGRCGAVFEALRHLNPPPQADTKEDTVVQTAHVVADSSEPSVSASPDSQVTRVQDAVPFAKAIHPPTETSAPDQAASSGSRSKLPWLLSCGVLSLALLWQIVVHKRDWLMAQEPALHGTLSVMCLPFGCAPQWPRLPESLQIESSSFTHDPQDFYSVQLRVKNIEHFPVAAPHVELSLLDVYDDVVLRRVFTPEELKLPEQMVPLRDARAGLDFDLNAGVAQRVTGYRVFLFYP